LSSGTRPDRNDLTASQLLIIEMRKEFYYFTTSPEQKLMKTFPNGWISLMR